MNLNCPNEIQVEPERKLWLATELATGPQLLPVITDEIRHSPLFTSGAGRLKPAALPLVDGDKQQAQHFEMLLGNMLTISLNVPTKDVEHELHQALMKVCALLGLDRASYWQLSSNGSLTIVPRPGNGEPLSDLNGSPDSVGQSNRTTISGHEICADGHSKVHFPWLTEQLVKGRIIAFSKPADLPAEAEPDKTWLSRLKAGSMIIFPFVSNDEVSGAVSFEVLRSETGWPRPLVNKLQLVAGICAGAMERRRAEEKLIESHAEIEVLKDRLRAETDYLKNEVNVTQTHEQVIGRAQSIRKVLRQVEQVAPTESVVLISGETGTGKELIAQEIHQLSGRKARAMMLVNCAALPSTLVESELFGRERGAYTGASSSQVGRFEMANGSTLFLDEVGELPLEIQAKLLRVLQEGEFQRLGSPKTHKVNVRIIAATNRDLAVEVRNGRFREDLYYRLKVFPIEMPPLRERTEDIPLLVYAFMQEFSTRMGKSITKVSRKSMEALQNYRWPGNIRELRNVIEHSLILSSGDSLSLSFLGETPSRETQTVTLAQAEREHIVKTLELTGWRIKGPHGAARKLDLEPSTLYSRMQKLGIPNRRQKDESTDPA